MESELLTRDEMIKILMNNKFLAVSHELFDKDEYLFNDGRVIRDENNYVFEDWTDPHHNGLRMRKGGNWETGWFTVPHIDCSKKHPINDCFDKNLI